MSAVSCLLISFVLSDSTGCSSISTPQHGSKTTSSTLPGTTVRFGCSRGYVRTGASSITCHRKGQWSDNPPTCKCMYPFRLIKEQCLSLCLLLQLSLQMFPVETPLLSAMVVTWEQTIDTATPLRWNATKATVLQLEFDLNGSYAALRVRGKDVDLCSAFVSWIWHIVFLTSNEYVLTFSCSMQIASGNSKREDSWNKLSVHEWNLVSVLWRLQISGTWHTTMWEHRSLVQVISDVST